jgi:hypothetical protein
MVCRRPPERASAPCRTVQSRAPRSGLTPDYATLIRIAASLNDASTARETEAASTLTLPLTRRGRESTGGCQVLRFAACFTRPDGTSARVLRQLSPVETTHPHRSESRLGLSIISRRGRFDQMFALCSVAGWRGQWRNTRPRTLVANAGQLSLFIEPGPSQIRRHRARFEARHACNDVSGRSKPGSIARHLPQQSRGDYSATSRRRARPSRRMRSRPSRRLRSRPMRSRPMPSRPRRPADPGRSAG